MSLLIIITYQLGIVQIKSIQSHVFKKNAK